MYEYDTDKEDELSLKEGETVKVTNQDSPDWWLAERTSNNKEFGLVPSNVKHENYFILDSFLIFLLVS